MKLFSILIVLIFITIISKAQTPEREQYERILAYINELQEDTVKFRAFVEKVSAHPQFNPVWEPVISKILPKTKEASFKDENLQQYVDEEDWAKIKKIVWEVLLQMTPPALALKLDNNVFKNGDTILVSSGKGKLYFEPSQPLQEVLWSGAVDRNGKGELNKDQISSEGTEVILSSRGLEVAVFVNTVAVEFARSDERAKPNRYGYDEYDKGRWSDRDHHISVSNNGGYTYLQARVTGKGVKNFKDITFQPADNSKLSVDTSNVNFNSKEITFRINGLSAPLQDTVTLLAVTKSTQQVVGRIKVHIYGQIDINNSRIFYLIDPGNAAGTTPDALNAATVSTEVNAYLGDMVAAVNGINQIQNLNINFDLNGNGRLDIFRNTNDGGPEIVNLEAQYGQQLRGSDFVVLRYGLNRCWKLPEDAINFPRAGQNFFFANAQELLVGTFYTMQLPNGDDRDIFKITRIDPPGANGLSRIEINVRFAYNHPYVPGNLVNSHLIWGFSFITVGLEAVYVDPLNPNDRYPKGRPALICQNVEIYTFDSQAANYSLTSTQTNTLSNSTLGKIVAHEVMHGKTLKHVTIPKNLMYCTADKYTSGDRPFRFKCLRRAGAGGGCPELQVDECQWDKAIR